MVTIHTPFGASLIERRLLWAPIYASVLEILGTTGTILPIGDALDEASNFTTVTTRGAEQVDFTYQGAGRDDWDILATLKGPGRIPVITLNGIDEEADTPDIAYFTRADAAWSIGAWVNLATVASSTILAKFVTGQEEWKFQFGSDGKLILAIIDEATGGNPTISVKANAAQVADVWVFVLATVDGSTDELGMNLYVDGVTIAQTQNDSGTFGIMVNGTSVVELGQHSAGTDLFDGSMAGGPLGPFFVQVELTADQGLRLYQLGREALNV